MAFDWEEPDEYGDVRCSHCEGTGYDPKHGPDSCWVCHGRRTECKFCGECSISYFPCEERVEHMKLHGVYEGEDEHEK